MVFAMSPQVGRSPSTAPERRFRLRHKVHSPAYATKDLNSSFILPHLNEIVDIGEDGMCFQNSSPLEPKESLKICLDLSETRTHIEADGEIIWSSDSGRTGVRFQKISKESLQQLRQWLFINSIIAASNYSSSTAVAKTEPEFFESGTTLLPDHSSALAAVAAISRQVAALGANIDAALQLIADRALTLTRATGAAIALSGSENMICRASSGSDAPPIGAVLQAGSGFSGECVGTGQLLHCEDAETDLRVDQQSCRALGVRSMIAAPVRSNGRVIGILEVFSPQPRIFTDSDKDILQRFAEIVSQAVHRSAALPAIANREISSATDITEYSPETLSDSDETTATSGFSRIVLALTAAGVIGLLALVVIPGIRSKTTDLRSAENSAPVSLSTNHPVGPAIEQDNLQALRRLAEQGDAPAQFALGARHATGEGVKQDYSEAARWFSLAAEHGNAQAQSVLAAYYWDGTGVPKDLSKAYFWAILARANGDEPSKLRAAELATRIGYRERNAIQQQADDWLKEHGQTTVSASSE
jgi:GAF domain-containing protein